MALSHHALTFMHSSARLCIFPTSFFTHCTPRQSPCLCRSHQRYLASSRPPTSRSGQSPGRPVRHSSDGVKGRGTFRHGQIFGSSARHGPENFKAKRRSNSSQATASEPMHRARRATTRHTHAPASKQSPHHRSQQTAAEVSKGHGVTSFEWRRNTPRFSQERKTVGKPRDERRPRKATGQSNQKDRPVENKAQARTAKDEDSDAQASKEPEAWQIQKAALERKFGDEKWQPRKRLSPDAIEGIRALHAQYPDKYTTPVLAKHFEMSPEAIRRILKSNWRPSADEAAERRDRWLKRGERIWTQMVELGVKPPKKWREMGIGKRPPMDGPWRRRGMADRSPRTSTTGQMPRAAPTPRVSEGPEKAPLAERIL